MKAINVLLSGILVVLILIWQKIPSEKSTYRTETTLLEPVEIAADQEVRISADQPIPVDIDNEPMEITTENGNPLPVEIQR
jgi:hypothetical protein